MRRPLSPRAEIIARGDDTATEMVMPEPIDDHAGEEMPGAVVDVGEPICQGDARRVRCRALFVSPGVEPVLFAVAGSHQHLQEAGCGLAGPVVRIAAAQVVDLVRVVAELIGRAAHLGSVDHGLVRFGFLRPIGVDGRIQIEPHLVLRLVPVEDLLSLLVVPLPGR